MIDKAMELIKKHEGSGPVRSGRYFPYACPAQKLTIGFGRNIEQKGISEGEANFLLHNDVQECVKLLRRTFIRFNSFIRTRQIALIDMTYNLGFTRFLTFKKMVAAIHEEDWKEAASQAKDSIWYNQVGNRGKTIVGMILGYNR